MRMSHYYAALAAVLAPALLLTAGLGLLHDGSEIHLRAGLLTAILCVATNTVFILFMIVTGRVLKQATLARSLPPRFLAELNAFFATKKGYPLALFSAVAVVATAVLGYGARIGVPPAVHMLLGTLAVVLNLTTIPTALATLRENQSLLDRVACELDRLDRELGPMEAGDVAWSYSPVTRWMVFGISAWLPYLYWGLVVWRGEFGSISPILPLGCGVASAFGLHRAWRARATTGG